MRFWRTTPTRTRDDSCVWVGVSSSSWLRGHKEIDGIRWATRLVGHAREHRLYAWKMKIARWNGWDNTLGRVVIPRMFLTLWLWTTCGLDIVSLGSRVLLVTWMFLRDLIYLLGLRVEMLWFATTQWMDMSMQWGTIWWHLSFMIYMCENHPSLINKEASWICKGKKHTKRTLRDLSVFCKLDFLSFEV
jgi:hypothetical protein